MKIRIPNGFKCTLFLYVLYLSYYVPLKGAIPGFATIGILLVAFFGLITVMRSDYSIRNFILPPNKLRFVFGGYCMIFGLLLCNDFTLFFDKIPQLLSFLVIAIFVNYIVFSEGDISFFLKMYTLIGLLIAVTIIFFGTYQKSAIDGGIVYCLSSTSNRNGDSMNMIFGVFSALALSQKRNNKDSIIVFALYLAIALICSYAVILTASRKGFASVCILWVFWVILVLPRFLKMVSGGKKVFIIVLVGILIAVFVNQYWDMLINSYAFSRMFERVAQGSTDERNYLVNQAMQLFKDNPIFGVGYNQLRGLIGNYAHNNYIEVLVNTGIIGFALYYSAYLMSFYKMLKKMVIKDVSKNKHLEYLMLLIMMVLLCILETALVTIEELNVQLMISLFIAAAYYDLSGDNSRTLTA